MTLKDRKSNEELMGRLGIECVSDVVRHGKLERNPAHVLHCLLPPPRPAAYPLRDRVHNHTLSVISASRRRNFINRLLFLDVY